MEVSEMLMSMVWRPYWPPTSTQMGTQEEGMAGRKSAITNWRLWNPARTRFSLDETKRERERERIFHTLAILSINILYYTGTPMCSTNSIYEDTSFRQFMPSQQWLQERSYSRSYFCNLVAELMTSRMMDQLEPRLWPLEWRIWNEKWPYSVVSLFVGCVYWKPTRIYMCTVHTWDMQSICFCLTLEWGTLVMDSRGCSNINWTFWNGKWYIQRHGTWNGKQWRHGTWNGKLWRHGTTNKNIVVHLFWVVL